MDGSFLVKLSDREFNCSVSLPRAEKRLFLEFWSGGSRGRTRHSEVLTLIFLEADAFGAVESLLLLARRTVSYNAFRLPSKPQRPVNLQRAFIRHFAYPERNREMELLTIR